MHISEYISLLEDIKRGHGDIPVLSNEYLFSTGRHDKPSVIVEEDVKAFKQDAKIHLQDGRCVNEKHAGITHPKALLVG